MKFGVFGLLALLLSGCASHDNGCDNTSCRLQSDRHHLAIWWPSDMRDGLQSYSKMPVR